MADESTFVAASVDLVDAGVGVRFAVKGTQGSLPAFLIRWRGSAHAYVNACPHQGSELDWLPGAFFDVDARYLICATHGALFEPDTGRCVSGPCAGSALIRVSIVEADGCVSLETELPSDP